MKIFVWSRWLDDILLGTKPPDGIGGAEVQMAMWAKTVTDFNHKSYTFAWRSRLFFKKNSGVLFLPFPWVRKIGVIFSPLKYLYIILIRPDIIILRSKFDLSNILWLKSKIKFKLIFMFASDKDLQIQNIDSEYCWQRKLVDADLVVTQNHFQSKALEHLHPSLNTILQPNIFHPIFEINKSSKQFDFVWVATLNDNKRPQWMINLAKSLPQYNFAMVGFGYDKILLNEVLDSERKLLNFKYLGYCSLKETLTIIASSKILINTSIFEGFPNVFLQAWSFGMPVISTVNPNGVFTDFKVGFLVENENELMQASCTLMNNSILFNQTVERIEKYFSVTHNPTNAYYKIFNKILSK